MLKLWKGMKGEIVQRLEHWNHNPNVVGSIPSFASFIKNYYHNNKFLPYIPIEVYKVNTWK